MKVYSTVFFFFLVSVLVGVSGSRAESLLTGAEVRELFNDTTMTVTNGRPSGKKGGPEEPFLAYTSGVGIAKTVYDDASSQTRAWHVAEDDRLCFSRSLSRRRQGSTCGFIVKDGSDYLFYESKDVKVKNGRVMGASKKDLRIIFSDFKSGNHLP